MSRWPRVVAVLMVVLMGFTALVTLVPNVQAALWTQDTDVDFNAGTLNGVEVVGTGPAAILNLVQDATDWRNETPPSNPGAREGPAMAYDSTNGVVVLFGGYNGAELGDTWEYDPVVNTWAMITPPSPPSARAYSGMTFDSANGVVVLFGGVSGTGFEADTWEYNALANTWTETTPGLSPGTMASYHLAFHSAASRSVLFGWDLGTNTMRTWAYDALANMWANRNPTGTPSNRASHAMAYDAQLNRIVLFGGSFLVTVYDETWEYDYSANSWTETTPLPPNPSPPPRTSAGMSYRSSQSETYLFGGNAGPSPLADTWRYFDPGGQRLWVNVITQRSPAGRHTFGMTDEASNSESIIFGGILAGGFRASDTWAFGPAYRTAGTFDSQTFDSFGANVNWNTIAFAPTAQPPLTLLRFQIAASNSGSGPWNYYGPACNSITYYTVSPSAICATQDLLRYLRVRAYMSTTNNLNTPSLDQFTIDYTVPAVDPYIVLTAPADSEFGVSQTAPIFIRFSEPMNPATVFYTIAPSVSVTETWTESDSALTLDHAAPLAECTAYTVTITAGNDASGAPLNNGLNLVPNPFSFVTLCDNPEIVTTDPPQGMMDVPLIADIVIDFSEPMDRPTVMWSIDPTITLSGSWTLGDTRLTLTHVGDFPQCTMHTVTIAGEDLAGLALLPGPAPNPFEFHTQCTIPFIVDTNPYHLEINVGLTEAIWVNFSESMDTPTVTWTLSPSLALTPQWWNGDMTLELRHATPFAACTVYTVAIPTGKDLDGNDLFPGQHESHAPNPWSFMTICPNPSLVVTIPMDGDTGVSQTANITIQFSEPMNPATVVPSITPFVPLTPSWNPSNELLTLSHAGFPFGCGPNVVTIQGEDVDGNLLVDGLAPNPWTFMPTCPNPFIMSTVPADLATGVALSAVIDVTFSEPMDRATVVWVIVPDVNVTDTWSANDTKLRLTPTASLAQSTQYTVAIPAGKDLNGDDLILGPAPNPWRFTTAAISPWIASTDPVDGATGVSTTAAVTLVFSEPMDTPTVFANATPPVVFIYGWSPDNMTLTLSHLAPFVECLSYSISVVGQDTTGDPLAAGPVPNPFDFMIVCTRPSITDTNPADGATSVPLGAAIWVNFSEPMDTATVSAVLVPGAGGLSYTWTNGNRTLSVAHASPFAECTIYAVTVAGNDTDGNALIGGPRPNPWSFRSFCTPPQIMSTVPVDGATGVSPTAAIVVTFSRAMNTGTVSANFVPVATGSSVWSGGDTILTLTPNPALSDCTSYVVTITGQDTNGNALVPGPAPNPFDFTTACPAAGPPSNLRITVVPPNILRLTWNAVPLADRYRVYESANRFASFPSGWNQLGEPTLTSFDAIGHYTDGQAHHYLVRSIRGSTESSNSSMAAKIVRAFPFNPGGSNAHWFSLPYRSSYASASDIATELGSGRVDVIGKWNPATQSSTLYYWFRGAWRGTDFTINAGDGLWLGAVSAFSWAILGTDPATTLSFTFNSPPVGNTNWVSVPLTGTYVRAADFVVDIEGNTGGGANTKIIDVVKWDSASQSFLRFYWTGGGWIGNNFVLGPGDAVYFTIVASFNWQPDLVTPEVP